MGGQAAECLTLGINQMPGVSCVSPDAGMFVMMNTSAVADGGQAFAERLLDEVGVSVVPGAGFGQVTVDYVRITLAQPISVLEKAMDRMAVMLGAAKAQATR